jgi:hypothetical protein
MVESVRIISDSKLKRISSFELKQVQLYVLLTPRKLRPFSVADFKLRYT